MSAPEVLGPSAEVATRLLFLTLGAHRVQVQAMERPPVRRRLAAPSFDGVQVQRQATVVRLVSIAESFCQERLIDRAEADVAPTTNSIRNLVWEKAALDATGSWRTLRDAFGSWYRVTPDWGPIGAASEVRNAIAHGLGQLTRRQTRKRVSTVDRIRSIGVRLDGDRVLLEEVDVQRIARLCAALIADVDGRMR